MKEGKQWCFCPYCGKFMIICDEGDGDDFSSGYCAVFDNNFSDGDSDADAKI